MNSTKTCTGRCKLDPTGKDCTGCGRTIEEIKNRAVEAAAQRQACADKKPRNKQAASAACCPRNV
ncbi:MAG: DUF1289 domain-containing protein [Caulobacteraceae bacterium]|nr:DUF1289 domain-containing protein [Caulobacteraceae bacterium]